MAHNYIKYPELTTKQINEMPFDSPHPQIEADFRAMVVRVHDGDTINVRTDFRDFDFPIRFLNIDAPELNAGGEYAQQWLENQILNQKVDIKINPKNRVDKYGRLLGTVFYRGLDMGQTELYLGLALPFNRRKEGQLPILKKELNVKKWF